MEPLPSSSLGPARGPLAAALWPSHFAHGLVVLGLAYAYGHISGTHINPAVTIGLLVGGQIEIGAAIGYIVAQLAGGIAGAAALAFALGDKAGALGATMPADGIGTGQLFFIEAFLTFLLVNTIYHTAVGGKAGNMAPVAIGMTLVFCILMGGPLTGASLNPARTLGPALFSDAPGAMSSLWVYLHGLPIGRNPGRSALPFLEGSRIDPEQKQ